MNKLAGVMHILRAEPLLQGEDPQLLKSQTGIETHILQLQLCSNQD